MSDFVGGQLLILKVFCPHAAFDIFSDAASSVLAELQGRIVIHSPIQDVHVLEPGSVPCHLWVCWLPDGQAAEELWTKLTALESYHAVTQPRVPVVLAVNGIGPDGFGPDIPTHANVPTNTDPDGPVYFLIEGTGQDQARMDQYRDILLPMMQERQAYYVAFELGGDVRVLSGEWQEAIFAISRWPGRSRAEECWTNKRYQLAAIPLRIDIGSFSVLVAKGNHSDG